MNYTEKFIKNAENQDIIKNEDLNKTKIFFNGANKILRDAISNSKELKSKFDDNNQIKRKYISDAYVKETFDNNTYKRPIIDLVQQGGGMYGIALLGYTYIMEKVGIRFYSHGGTSAGAINATFLAAISKDIYKDTSIFSEEETKIQATKSELLTHLIINTSFGDFIDRPGFTGRIQRFLFKKAKIFKLILVLLLGIFPLGIYIFFGEIFKISNGLNSWDLRYYDFIIGSLNVIALLILIYILFIRLLEKKFGFNSGETFFNWSNSILTLLKINNTNDLEIRMKEVKVSGFDENDIELNKPRLVLITSNLTHNRIVKFPERAIDYWDNYKKVKPAAYLRATMSLPFIFQSFIPDDLHFYNKSSNDSVIKKARFVDGGMLSNFPIREFHRKDNKKPLFPTFGVLLSKIKKNKDSFKEEMSLLEYIKTFFKTFRNFYDADFIFNSEEIKDRVVLVNTFVNKEEATGKHYNWLNFWMDYNTQKELFFRGAEAAIVQLEQFNWKEYSNVRMKIIESKTKELV